MKFFITPELLHKYVDGQCTDEEIFLLHQWYDSFEDHEDPFEALTGQEQEVLKILMLENFKASLKMVDAAEATVVHRNIFGSKLIYALSGIAALCLVVWGVYFKKNEIQNSTNTIITTASEVMVLNNQTNSIYKQILSDKSIVWLSPKSQLQYPKRFVGTYRQVKITGEAFFEVSKDHAHPFIINGGGIITRVWGTSFRVKAYRNIPTEVSVVTGKVSVKLPEKDESEIMLYPKQKAVYTSTNHLLIKANESKQSAMRMWEKVSVSFENTPLDKVLNTLREQYGMLIYTNDKDLEKYTLKADFTGQSLPAILEMLQNSLNVGYTIDDTKITLYRKTPNN